LYGANTSGASALGGAATATESLSSNTLLGQLAGLVSSGALNDAGVREATRIASSITASTTDWYAAQAEYNDAKKRGDMAAMAAAQAKMDAATISAHSIAADTNGLISDPMLYNGSERSANIDAWLDMYGISPETDGTMAGQDPATARYSTMESGKWDTTNPGLVQGAYTYPYQFSPYSSDPVSSSNALEQQTNSVVNFNDDALAQLYNSPEYQAANKNNYLELLRYINNTKGTLSGSTGIASSGTASAIAQGANQIYGELYDAIPAIIQNLYGREVTGLDAIRQYESDAYARGADQRDYDTALYEWQYAQNKDNFLQDRNFQYLLNRDWIADARYADETAWNRALAERQQAFAEWSSTYRNADGTALSPAQYEQAQQAFENELAIADLARLQALSDAQAANYYNGGSGSGSGGSGGGTGTPSTLLEPPAATAPATEQPATNPPATGGSSVVVQEETDNGALQQRHVVYSDGTQGMFDTRPGSAYALLEEAIGAGRSLTSSEISAIIDSGSDNDASKAGLRKYLAAGK
jgi:hypothetical protein